MNGVSDRHGELESTVEYLVGLVRSHRRGIFWALSFAVLFWLMSQIREVTVLLCSAYLIAVLINPLVFSVSRRLRLGRTGAIVLILFLFFVLVLGSLTLLIPYLISEYSRVIKGLPAYVDHFLTNSLPWLQSKFGLDLPVNKAEWLALTQQYAAMIDYSNVSRWLGSLMGTVTHGYSIAMTIANLILLPVFVFYITRDLGTLHSLAYRAIPADYREQTVRASQEILGYVRAFFKGQFSVSLLLMLFYSAGLGLVGLHSGFFIGMLSGLLSLIPYMGLIVGITIATIVGWVTDGSWSHLLAIWAVFGVVQMIEGIVLTPKIVGESVGIHPVGVIVALLIGGQLFGLLGLVLAIPGAAALKVVFRNLREVVESGSEIHGV